MKNVTFFLIKKNISHIPITTEQLACKLAISNWRDGRLVLIACENNAQALRIDEALWIKEPNAFIPHNLSGEIPISGTPVEICWPQCYSSITYDLLINLMPICADFTSSFHKIIDFVPEEINLKQLARDRYRSYRNVGFQLITSTVTTLELTNNSY